MVSNIATKIKEFYHIRFILWSVKQMEEWISGLYYKQEGYNVELFHKLPGIQEPNIIGTVNLKKKEYQKIDDARTTVGKYFKNTFISENQDILIVNLKKHLYKLKIQEDKKKKEITELVIPNRNITTWEQLKEVTSDTLFNRESEVKIILATIISKWFQKNTSIYLMLIGIPGCGKSTLTDCFDGNEFTLHNDEVTMQSFIPGTTDATQKSSAFLKLISGKTLMTQDLSGILGTDERLIRRFIRFLSAVYGRKVYRKHSPGTGLMILPADFNFIFGITPYVLFDKGMNFDPIKEIINSQKFLFLRMDVDVEVENRIIDNDLPEVDLQEVQEAVRGFLKNKEKESKGFQSTITKELTEQWKLKFEEYNEKSKYWNGEYHKNQADKNRIRLWHEFRSLSTAFCLIEGRKEVNREDIDNFFELLTFGN